MKLNISLLIFLILIVTFSYAAAQSNSESEVKQLERVWLDAYEQRDSKAMEAIVADDFTITFSNGAVQTKPQIINSLNAARVSSGSSAKFRTEDVQARVYGDTGYSYRASHHRVAAKRSDDERAKSLHRHIR